MLAADEDHTRVALEHAFTAYRQYHETVAAGDDERIEELARLAALVAAENDWTVSHAAVKRPDGTRWVCLLLV
jgi:hypothetical protein